MRNIKQLLGARIREIRKKNKLTQEKLAELVGIGTPNISYIETGRFEPSMDTLEKISDVLGVYPYELYMFEHLKTKEDMQEEIINAIKTNDHILELIYKFYQSIK